jgi:hypothetical protein
MENINDMIKHALLDDKDSFYNLCKKEMEERISSSISDSGKLVSKNLLHTAGIEESRNAITYSFPSSSVAKKFVSASIDMGINKKSFSVNSNNVLVSEIKDNEMKKMLEMLIKDMKGKLREEFSFINAITESLDCNSGSSFVAEDGSNIHIKLEEAKSFSAVHDLLNDENQNRMRNLIEKSENDYNKIIDFCKNQFKQD